MLGFQYCERLIKLILPFLSFAGSPETIPKVQQKLLEEYSRDTMGMLVGEYVELLYGNVKGQDERDGTHSAPYVTFTFKREGNDSLYEERKRTLKELVAERNHLVHHFFDRWDRNSLSSSEDAHVFLTGQLDRIKTFVAELKAVLEDLSKVGDAMSEYPTSGQAEMDLLRHSKIPVLLGQLAANEGDVDGWVSLSRAGNFLHEFAADDMKELERRYGVAKLRALMTKTGLFEFREDATTKGVRPMYRVNPDWALKFESL